MTRHSRRAEVAKLRAFTRVASQVRDLVRAGEVTSSSLKAIAVRTGTPMHRMRAIQAAIERKEAANDGSYAPERPNVVTQEVEHHEDGTCTVTQVWSADGPVHTRALFEEALQRETELRDKPPSRVLVMGPKQEGES